MPKFSAFDLAQATEQVPGRFVVQLTFGELCDAYESAHPTAAAARLRKWREAFGDRGAWDIDRDTFARAGEAMTQAGYSPSSVNRDLSAIGGMYRWAHDVRTSAARRATRDIRPAEERLTETCVRRAIESFIMALEAAEECSVGRSSGFDRGNEVGYIFDCCSNLCLTAIGIEMADSNMLGAHDAPLSDRADDLLNRWSVARSIDRAIFSAPQGWSTRIGLYGPWGGGKTTVLRFLRALSEERGDIVVEFSAWQSVGEGGVLQHFHKELLAVLEAQRVRAEPVVSRVKRRVSRLSSWIGTAGAAGAQAAGPVEGNLGEVIAAVGLAVQVGSGTLGDMVRLKASDLQKLQRALGARRVVVFIDDLDRADPRTVPKALLALRELLDWPNFAFVLAFDKAIVARALGEYSIAFGESADDFLEKVVDMPFELPAPTPEQISKLALVAMSDLCNFIPVEARAQAAAYFPENPRQAKQVVRALSALRIAAERHDPGELNWLGIVLQTILRLAAADAAAMLESRLTAEAEAGWVTEEQRKTGRALAVQESLAVDKRKSTHPTELAQRRARWLTHLMSEIQLVRRRDNRDRLNYEMRLVTEEPAFTHREIRDLIERAAQQPGSVSLAVELSAAVARSNATRDACALELADGTLVQFQNAVQLLSHANTAHSAGVARAELREIVSWIEFAWADSDADITQVTRSLRVLSNLVGTLNIFALHARDSIAAELLQRHQKVVMRAVGDSQDSWLLFFALAPKYGAPNDERVRQQNAAICELLAPAVAEEILAMFLEQDGLERRLRSKREESSGDLLWSLEVSESPIYRPDPRQRLIALFDFGTNGADEPATHVRRNAERFLSTIAMMTSDSSFITDYPSFGSAQGEVLSAAWACAINEDSEFRNEQRLVALRQHLVGRGLQERLFPMPLWLADAKDPLAVVSVQPAQ